MEDWIVSVSAIWLMPKADPTLTHKDRVGQKKENDILKGTSMKVDGYRWLRLEHEGKEAWALIDGEAAGGKGAFLEQPVG
mmetsp:Transcript_29304/g.68124  ORF Transcript_29304/g.68124 Transcript_29304/m.68124 type:complete len:80 (-) Transcript_29304:108-347(-)|eukprot:CAMPEP_0171066822 /NCGR_PEP_ID=MMETSP0766_2-20121228/7640_1 /TAXON_ID=439317 /ORGANISM="Gambierdiscus australes, Strain CAWD 149" /LENGTH=79 /DNA_ID=CAMNT_0011523013 /DNA_START=61 /DNA_END=300 /DNA_ORIENTATION=-